MTFAILSIVGILPNGLKTIEINNKTLPTL